MRFNNVKSQKGITLIALVVTIIVLLILAGVSISMVFSNNGIIKKAQDAQNKMNEAVKSDMDEINKLTNLLDNYIGENKTEEGKNTSGGETTTEPEKLNASNYIWTQNKTEVTGTPKSGSGKAVTLTVGEEYDYTVTGVSGGYTGKWGVLGAGKAGTTEAGKLLIMTTSNVVDSYTLEGKDGYNNGISYLNDQCIQKCGTGARSTNVDDINRVTGYDPTNQGDGTVAYAGQWIEYGNVVTYTASKTTSTKVTTPYNGRLQGGKYEHPDGRTIGSNNTTSITETSTIYWYYPHSLTTSSAITGDCKGISTSSVAYEMIFGTYANTSSGKGSKYWLASSFVVTGDAATNFCVRIINSNGDVSGYPLWNSGGSGSVNSYAVRAVIAL